MKKYLQVALPLVLAFSVASATAVASQLVTTANAPHSLKILPPPPAESSAMFAADQSVSNLLYLHHSKKQWEQAIIDADKSTPEKVVRSFQAAFGHVISVEKTPAIIQIIHEISVGKPKVVSSAKNYYMRGRPYAFYNRSSCWHKKKETGSYPSGHTTVGWAVALVLAEINPDRANEILKRGYDYGQSRIVCGAHWQSDVNAGRVTGSALYSSLHTHREFQHLIDQARHEIKE